MSRHISFSLAAMTLAGLVLGLGACGKKPDVGAKQQARTISMVNVEPRDINGGLTASGSLLPREDTAVFPQISGYRVAKVLVDEGAWVKVGQPLVQLDDTLLRSQVAQQSALAAQARALASQAESQAARGKAAAAADLLSQEQLDTRRYAAESTRAQAMAQEAAAQDVRTRAAMMVVRAPSAGLVIARNVHLGDMAAAGGTTPFYRIAKDGQIELVADISEDALGKIHTGDTVLVTLGNGSQVHGTVRIVSPGIDPTTRLSRVRISLPVRTDIRAGGFARATFVAATKSALSVPETAVRYDADGAAVLVLGPDNKLSRAPVTTGERGGGYVELLTGPPAGSVVVAKAAAMLVPGDVVRAAPAP